MCNVHPSKLEIRFRDEMLVRESAAQLLFEKVFSKEHMTDIMPSAVAGEPTQN
jgi:DNA mismatch repair ATPase MutL